MPLLENTRAPTETRGSGGDKEKRRNAAPVGGCAWEPRCIISAVGDPVSREGRRAAEGGGHSRVQATGALIHTHTHTRTDRQTHRGLRMTAHTRHGTRTGCCCLWCCCCCWLMTVLVATKRRGRRGPPSPPPDDDDRRVGQRARVRGRERLHNLIKTLESDSQAAATATGRRAERIDSRPKLFPSAHYAPIKSQPRRPRPAAGRRRTTS